MATPASELLAELRDAVAEVKREKRDDPMLNPCTIDFDDAMRIVTAFDELDALLTAGGPLPASWSKRRK